MMSESFDLDRHLKSAQARLYQIEQQAAASGDRNPLLAEAITELSISLEELTIATEELNQQNTELIASREELEWERQRYQNLFDFAPDAYLVTNEKGIVLAANEAGENLLNVRWNFFINKPLILFIAEADHPFIYNQLETISQSTTRSSNNPYLSNKNQLSSHQATIFLQNREVSLLSRNQEIFPASLSLSGECDRQGKFVRLYWLFHDLRQRKQAEEKIRQQAALLDITSDAIFVHDLENRILYWNRGAEKLYGWSATEAIGKLLPEILPNNEFQAPTIRETLLNRGEWRDELFQVTKGGQEVIVEARWTIIRDDAGQPQSILSVETDITDKKQLENQFYRDQRLESLGLLTSGIAHELNNVLTPILGFSQLLLLKDENLEDESEEMLKLLESNAKQGADIIKQILTFARGTNGHLVNLQVEFILKQVIKVVKQTFPKSIAIHHNIPEEPLKSVYVNPTQIQQILMNICLNARDAMPNGGTLTLAVENYYVDQIFAQMNLDAQVGDYVMVTITDNGTGIPSDLLNRIFDPFFTTKEVGKGTGLGLATVLGIVKNYGGFLQVSSKVGKGTQFKVYLPTTEEIIAEEELVEEIPQGNRELILIVDDNLTVQLTHQSVLESYNYNTLVANDGIGAIALYAEYQEQIKFVLLDTMMPNMDGIRTIHELKKINPNIKIIGVSGLSSNRESMLAAGANGFLVKPYNVEELLKSVSHL